MVVGDAVEVVVVVLSIVTVGEARRLCEAGRLCEDDTAKKKRRNRKTQWHFSEV